MSLGMQLVTSAPTDAGDGWDVMYQNGYTSARDVFAWVICANVGVSGMSDLGPIGRLGRLAAEHRGRVFVAWALIAVALGVLAPRVETALSGAGWQASGSESVEAREQIDRNFAGAGAYALQVAVHSQDHAATAPEFRQTMAARSGCCGTIPPSAGSCRRGPASRSRPTATQP